MFKDSSELLEYALRKLQVAIEKNEVQVEILLDERFPNDTNSVKKYCDELEVKTITELLREEFKNYDIRSVVESKGYLQGIITFTKGPCIMAYPLVWILTLQKK